MNETKKATYRATYFNLLWDMPRTVKDVLLEIAKNGPGTKYKVESATKVNHASVYTAVKRLLSVGAVEGKQVGKTRTGLPKTSYTLTFPGLCLAIRTADFEDIDKIVKKWRHLEPLLLGKWEYFKDKVGVKEAEDFVVRGIISLQLERRRGFHDLAATFLEEVESFPGASAVRIVARTGFSYTDTPMTPEEFRRSAISALFAFGIGSQRSNDQDFLAEYEEEYGRTPSQSFQRWVEAIIADSELKNYFNEYVEGALEGAHQTTEFYKSLKQVLAAK